MDKQEMVFKTTAFGGFDKTSVMDFIFKLNEESETAQNRLKTQLEEITQAHELLEKNLQKADEQVRRLQNDFDNATTELDGERLRTNELSALNDELQGRLEQAEQRFTQKRQEAEQRAMEALEQLAAVRQETEALRRQCEKVQQELDGQKSGHQKTADDLEAERRELERNSAQIGKVLIDAHKEAELIAEKARQQSEAVVNRAKAIAEGIMTDANNAGRYELQKAKYRASLVTQEFLAATNATQEQFLAFQAELLSMRDNIVRVATAMLEQGEQIEQSVSAAEKSGADAVAAAANLHGEVTVTGEEPPAPQQETTEPEEPDDTVGESKGFFR